MTSHFMLAQSGNNEEAIAIAAGIGAIVGIVIAYAILGVICWMVADALKKVPQAHRKMEPGQVWMLLIPCFGIVWNFFVFQRVPDSFKGYFDSIGRQDVGDCGKQLGLIYSICAAVSVIPFLGYLTGLAALVLLIILLVKFNELKKQITA